jgi:hypothetical protein
MNQPFPKSSLETAYRLVVDIAEILLVHNVPLHQYNPDFPFRNPTPSKAEIEGLDISYLLNPDGSKYIEDPNNASVIPSDVLDRLADAINALAEIEEKYWSNK